MKRLVLAASGLLILTAAAVSHHYSPGAETFARMHGAPESPEALHHGGHVHELQARALGTVANELGAVLTVKQLGEREGSLATLDIEAAPGVAQVTLRAAGEADAFHPGLTFPAEELALTEHVHMDAPMGEDVRLWVSVTMRDGRVLSNAWALR